MVLTGCCRAAAVCCLRYCRVRQWTGDTQGWYKQGYAPVLGGAGPAYVLFYGIITGAFLLLMLCRGGTFHAWTLGSSQRMHSKMVHK